MDIQDRRGGVKNGCELAIDVQIVAMVGGRMELGFSVAVYPYLFRVLQCLTGLPTRNMRRAVL